MKAKRIEGDKTTSGCGRKTANDRFKATYGVWLWGGIIVATAFHFAVIEFFPPLTAADLSFGVTEIEVVELPPEIDVPPPPKAVTRPAVPVVARAALEEDITIAPTTFEQNPVETLPPPPTELAALTGGQPGFTPYTVAPALRDRELAARIVRQKYPEILLNAGIGGTVVVWAYIDTTGVVRGCQIHTSCGFAQLDEAALSAAVMFRFHPALNYDRHVPVWVSIPITFSTVG